MEGQPPTTSDEITWEEVGAMETPPVQDPHRMDLERKVIANLEKKQIEQEIKGETGPAPQGAPIPPDVPYLVSHMAAKAIGCPQLECTPEENRIIAHHLSIIFPTLSSKIISAGIILVIVISKVIQCKDAILAKFKSIKDGAKNAT